MECIERKGHRRCEHEIGMAIPEVGRTPHPKCKEGTGHKGQDVATQPKARIEKAPERDQETIEQQDNVEALRRVGPKLREQRWDRHIGIEGEAIADGKALQVGVHAITTRVYAVFEVVGIENVGPVAICRQVGDVAVAGLPGKWAREDDREQCIAEQHPQQFFAQNLPAIVGCSYR